MGEAFWWGLLGGIALLIGAVLSFGSFVTKRALGLAMAFGAGVLISAVAFDLVEEAFLTTDRGGTVGTGMLAGAFVFFLGDAVIDRMGGANRKRSSGDQAGDASIGIVLGAVLDGIPESDRARRVAAHRRGGERGVHRRGVHLQPPRGAGGQHRPAAGGLVPRPGSSGCGRSSRSSPPRAAAFGYVALDGASPEVTAFTLAFAGGAVLTMLADTMMPEAFEHGGRVVGLLTTAGFGVAFFLHNLG